MIWQESWASNWHRLSEKYTGGGGCLETLAATCEQGVAIIVKWKRESIHDPFEVEVMDTAECKWMPLKDYTFYEYIPTEPPENLKY